MDQMADIVAKCRIEHLQELLLASGWVRSPDFEDGWNAPEYMREALALEMGRGCVAMKHAVAAQVAVDQARLASSEPMAA
jgi:hypothetical protein